MHQECLVEKIQMDFKVHWLNGYIGFGAPKWIYENWARGFKQIGVETQFWQSLDDLNNNIFFCSSKKKIVILDFAVIPFRNEQLLKMLANWQNKNIKIISTAYWPHEQNTKVLFDFLRCKQILFFFGERENDSMSKFCSHTKTPYYVIPNSFDPDLYSYNSGSNSYLYDVSFIGAKLPKKKWFNKYIIPDISKRYKAIIHGPYWSRQDNIYRLITFSFKKLRFFKIARFLDGRRNIISEKMEDSIYKTSKINLNFHERTDTLSQDHHLVNQRVFKIAGAGGLQLCDPVQAIFTYFPNNEILTAPFNPASWFRIIDDAVKNPYKYDKIRFQSMETAHNHHTCKRRAVTLLELIQKHT